MLFIPFIIAQNSGFLTRQFYTINLPPVSANAYNEYQMTGRTTGHFFSSFDPLSAGGACRTPARVLY